MRRPTDRAISVRSVAVEEEALDRLYRSYAVWLSTALRRRFRARLGDAAEDLVHDTYIRVRAYPQGDLRNPRALLLRVATNLAHDHIRKTARMGLTRPIEETDKSVDYGIEADQNEAVLLKQIVLSLPHPLKDVFLLSRFAGLSQRDIAERVGVSVKTVEGRMARALAFIAERLRDPA